MTTPTERQLLPPLVGSDSAILACLPFPAVIFDIKSLYVIESNAFFCNERGCDVADLLGKYDLDLLDPEDLQQMRLVLLSNKSNIIHKLSDCFNNIRTFEIVGNLLPDDNSVFLYFNELSSHVVDSNRNSTYQILKEFIDKLHEGVALIDSNYKIIFCNSLFASFFSLKENGLVGSTFPELLSDHSSEVLAELDINKYGLDTSLEMVIPQNDINHQFFLFQFVPRFDSRHGYSGSFVTIQNISERKRAEKELLTTQSMVQEADRLKTSFLTNISHEIRTPMNSILGFSAMLKRSGLSKAKKDQFLDIIISKGKHLMSIISDIIDITKIDGNQIHLSSGPCGLNHLMEELYENFQQEIEKTNKPIKLILNSSLRGSSDCIMVDSMRLTQVLTNLLNNALKFTEVGYVEFGFRYADAESLLFYVKDTGIGVLPGLQEIIFERFRQADESFTRQYGGSGLGLAISRGLVQLMGGKIWVESDGSSGSAFSFTIPLIKPDVIEEEAKEKVIPKWCGKTILIIEDDQASFQLLHEFLELSNCAVLHASNGNDALNCLKENKDIDMVLLDIQLPMMNGYEIARSIRNMNLKIPIVAQTAHAMGSDKARCLKAGCDDYLSKPIQFDVLEKMLEKYLL